MHWRETPVDDKAWNNPKSTKIIGHSTKTIYPRFKDRKYRHEKIDSNEYRVTQEISKTEYDNKYPLRYIGPEHNVLNKLSAIYHNDEQISKELTISYKYEKEPYYDIYHYYLDLWPVGYYVYSNPVDRLDGGSELPTLSRS